MLKRGLEDIEEGMEYDTEVIIHSDRTLDIYLDIVQSSEARYYLYYRHPRLLFASLKQCF